jgi:hypothetical protein
MKALITIGWLLSGTAWGADALWQQVENARRDGPIADVNAATQHAARVFFRVLAQEAAKDRLSPKSRSRASALGLHLRVEGDRVLLWGRDEPHGLFVFRLGPAREILLQAPHSFYDLGSGDIQSRLFDALPVRAAFFNSAHRYGGPGLKKEDRLTPSPDLAHRPHTLFQAATLGLSEALNDLVVIQVHGFRSRQGESVVLTAGSALQPARLERSLHHRLQSIFSPIGPVVTGAARPELAATGNLQGQILSSQSAFLHVELSKTARENLLSDPSLMAAFGQSLLAVQP